MRRLRKSTWTTYKITCYMYSVAQDQASAGGVHKHQVRKTRDGWQYRIVQSNGPHSAAGPTYDITEAEGEERFATAGPD